jgi:hypothetical protein
MLSQYHLDGINYEKWSTSMLTFKILHGEPSGNEPNQLTYLDATGEGELITPPPKLHTPHQHNNHNNNNKSHLATNMTSRFMTQEEATRATLQTFVEPEAAQNDESIELAWAVKAMEHAGG